MLKKLTGLLILEIIPIVIAAIFAVTIFVYNRFLPDFVPLFYSLTWGQYQLAGKPQLYILPAIAASISLINLMIYWHIKDSILIKQVLLMSSLVSSLILIISYIKIVSLFI